MKRTYRPIETILTTIGLFILIWFIASWINVLATQMDGNTATWNLFLLLTKLGGITNA